MGEFRRRPYPRNMNLEAGPTGHEIIVAQMPSKIKTSEEKGRFILTLAFRDEQLFCYVQSQGIFLGATQTSLLFVVFRLWEADM